MRELTDEEARSPHWRAYFRQRQYRSLRTLVLGEFQASGLTVEQLAERMGVSADDVWRNLFGHHHWSLYWASDVLMAMSRKALLFQLSERVQVRLPAPPDDARAETAKARG